MITTVLQKHEAVSRVIASMCETTISNIVMVLYVLLF